MTIRIIEDGPDIQLTRSEYNRLLQEYEKAFMFYAGVVPTFEDWVRNRQGNSYTTWILNNEVRK